MATAEASGPSPTIGINSIITSSPLPSFSAASSPSSEFTFTISLYPSPLPLPAPPPPPPPPTTVDTEKPQHAAKDDEEDLPRNNIFLQSRIFPLRHLHRRPHLPSRAEPQAEPQAAPPRRSTHRNTLSVWLGRSKRRWLEVGRAVRRWIEATLFLSDRGNQGRGKSFSSFSCNSYSTGSDVARTAEGRRSGVCSREWIRSRARELSASRTAPPTAKTTPTNSGLLTVKGKTMGLSSSEESTMEELHCAIQAAIAHCKNSIATSDDDHQLAEKKTNTHSFSSPLPM